MPFVTVGTLLANQEIGCVIRNQNLWSKYTWNARLGGGQSFQRCSCSERQSPSCSRLFEKVWKVPAPPFHPGRVERSIRSAVRRGGSCCL